MSRTILARVDAVDTAQLDVTSAAFWSRQECLCKHCQIAVEEEGVYVASP